MSVKTVIQRTLLAGAADVNVLANSRFQFADNPGPEGAVQVDVSVTSEVAGNTFEATVDKDFVAQEFAFASADPPKTNENPGLSMLVQPGSQINIDLRNNDVATRTFFVQVEFTPV